MQAAAVGTAAAAEVVVAPAVQAEQEADLEMHALEDERPPDAGKAEAAWVEVETTTLREVGEALAAAEAAVE